MEAKNIDDILVTEMSQQSNIAESPDNVANSDVKVEEPHQEEAIQTEPEQVKEQEPQKATETSSDNSIDEYGNPVEKNKVYTQDEVNRLIRERLSRGKFAEQNPIPEVQTSQPKTQEQVEDWQAELETFVEKTIEKRQTKLAEQQWRQQEMARQAEFEAKFNAGMSKYNDFDKVVSGKPITDSMVLATRNLENPAAFVYGASKFHPQELERISRILDPYSQAAEIGRLHEKMIKAKNIVSNAPKPLEVVTGDIPTKKINDLPPIDERIHQYAKQKRK